MKINLPSNDLFPQFEIVVSLPNGSEISATYDNSHREAHIELPAGVSEDDVEVLGCALSAQGQPAPGCGPCVIKERVAKPEPKPESRKAKKPEPKAEPVVEPAPVEKAVTERQPNLEVAQDER
ncbi:MAG: hypothetical protein ABFC88_12920 [Thermoguttaceae bacterium]